MNIAAAATRPSTLQVYESATVQRTRIDLSTSRTRAEGDVMSKAIFDADETAEDRTNTSA
jgi:hypothetical protein